MTDSGQDQYLTTVEEEPDDLDLLLEGELSDPEFERAYEDASLRERLLRDLSNARVANHLTQTAVAERMGTTQSAISEIEGGATDPRLSTLQRYARGVGIHSRLGLSQRMLRVTTSFMPLSLRSRPI